VAQQAQHVHEVHAVEPRVRLIAHTQQPFQIAVASARTCYASEFVFVGRLSPKGERTRVTLEEALPQHKSILTEIGQYDTPHERRIELVEAIRPKLGTPDLVTALESFADLARQRAEGDSGLAHSIYEAGHHTPFQHPTFVFSLEGVSRNVVESFFHNHTFYNSEQQSQRYVEMKRADVVVPPAVKANVQALAIYENAIRTAWDAYHDLRDHLVQPNLRVMSAIGKVKGQTEKQIHTEAEKKSQEMARYVIPIAAATQMYHTISGIVLLRYLRMCEAGNTPDEARLIVQAMVEEVRKIDAAFVERIEESPRPRGLQIEGQLQPGSPEPSRLAVGSYAKLLHATPDAAKLVVDALRHVTGSTLPTDQLLQKVLDPGQNEVWNDTLNTWDHSPALRTLRHVHYTFLKRLSLTAYAQDQRHRMTPGSRPLLQRCLTEKPDVHVPAIIAGDSAANSRFEQAITALWSGMQKLRALGIPDEQVVYLLPNATNITFHQSGDLLSFIHKWRLRLCFNAQKEIFDASLEELRQVQAVHPELTQWLGPPCTFVAAAQPPDKQNDVAACCPEGPRWCGVKVWIGFDAAKGKPKRPY
jgi:thymidylate synthase ThyX